MEKVYSFDDILLMPGYSDIIPAEVEVKTRLSEEIVLNIPLLSAAMDTITESRTAIVIAREGGMGVIHKNMSIAEQVKEVEKVKKSESGMIVDPVTIGPNNKVVEVLELMKKFNISGIPVVAGKRLVGIVTNRDLRFEENLDKKVSAVMTKKNLVTVSDGTNLSEAKSLMHEHRIEKLPVINNSRELIGLITIKDIAKIKKYPFATKDSFGRLRVGAAVGVGPEALARTEALLAEGTDAICVDSAHGHSANVVDSVYMIRKNFPQAQIIAGNVATAQGVNALITAGANAIKVGMGPGSICTTRVIAGIGVPQVSAIMNCRDECNLAGVSLIADGGIKYSGDITKAIAVGADSVMIGSLFAGAIETPGEEILLHGKRYKLYRGMGSIDAMRKGSSDRYAQAETPKEKFVPEGIVGRVPFRGSLADNIHQLIGGLKAGMGYTGCKNIKSLQNYGAESKNIINISPAGLTESHVHDVEITKEAPNYRLF